MQNVMIILLTCSAFMSVLGLIYIALTPLLEKRYSTKGRYYAWLMIVVGLIVPFRPQFSNSIVKITPTNTITPMIQIGNSAPIISPFEHSIAHDTSSSVIPPSVISSSVTIPSLSLWQIVTIVWFAGVVMSLAYSLIKHYRSMAMVKRWSEPITNEQTLSLLQNLKIELDIAKQIDFQQCLCIGSPMLVGFKHPCILLPKADFEGEGLYFILKHELIHYKRKDLWYKLFVVIATALHWFNPIVYLMARAIEVLCELSCDAEVVRSTDGEKRQHYTEVILGVAKYQFNLKTNLSTNFYGGKSGMKKRILSIMDTSGKKAGIGIICAVALLILGTGTACAVNSVPESTQKSNPNSEQQNIVPTNENLENKNTEDIDYKLPMEVIGINGIGDVLLNYDLICLAYDKNGQPLKLYWDWDAIANREIGNVGYSSDHVGNGIVTEMSPVSYQYIYMGNSTSPLEDIDEILLNKAIEVDEETRESAKEIIKRWVRPGETQGDGYILFDRGNQSTGESEVNYIISFIKSVTFEDGTVWENPEYENWLLEYEGKSVDLDILTESP